VNIANVEALLGNPTEDAVRALLHDRTLVFWVDWRQEDDAIPNLCEEVLRTGELAGKFVETDYGDGFEVHILYKGVQIKVPLKYSPDDRHITLRSLNEVIFPDFEIRFCIDSNGNDTLAFLPLATENWTRLEMQYGEIVSRHFYAIAERPNLFTEDYPPKITWQELAMDPGRKVDAIKLYRDQGGVGLGEAKQVVEAYIKVNIS
jgi:hypothetical protein